VPADIWGDPVQQRGVWESHDPYFHAKALRRIPVFLSAGNGQQGPLDTATPSPLLGYAEGLFERMGRALAEQLEEAGARVTTDFYGPGTHSWPYWEREFQRSLPVLLCGLGVDA
jgi:diacylglycerol O-acyltransferase/trehalose O-mycolyltransferase